MTTPARHQPQLQEEKAGGSIKLIDTGGCNVELAALQFISTLQRVNIESEDSLAWLLLSLCHLFQSEGCALILLDEVDPRFITKKILFESNESLYSAGCKLETGLIMAALQAQTVQCLNHPGSDSQFNPSVDWVADLPFNSVMCASLSSFGIVLGAIELLNKHNSTFDHHDQELFKVIVDGIAAALQNSRSIQQLKVANADLEAKHWELLNSRNTLRGLFDSTPMSIYMIDQKYRLVAINRRRAALAAREPSELVGRECYQALFHLDGPCAGCRVSETLFGGHSTERIHRRWEADEKLIELQINAYPIFNNASQVVQAYLFEEDVTERRRMEATLAQSEKLAAVGQLTAGVAHEINNPLTAIIANIQMLQRKLPGDSDIQEMIELITLASNRAAQVVRNLLDFTRKERYEFTPTDINETLYKTISLIQHELVARSIDLSFTPADNLPDILASSDHLQGVWLNMLINAIDSFENQPGEIHVSTALHENEIHVKIADKGKGIPIDQIPRVFEPFYTTKAPGKGTGLGLSVCHRIIVQHGGHILVDSQMGIGTVFTIVFPIK